MGFLDKVKTQAEQLAKQGQEKLDDVQAKKKADGLLRDLGAWHYATETARDGGQGEAEIARIVGELQAHEAEHGPLGGDKEAAGAESAAPPVAPPDPAAAPPAPSAPPASAPSPPPAPPAPPFVPPTPGSPPSNNP